MAFRLVDFPVRFGGLAGGLCVWTC